MEVRGAIGNQVNDGRHRFVFRKRLARPDVQGCDETQRTRLHKSAARVALGLACMSKDLGVHGRGTPCGAQGQLREGSTMASNLASYSDNAFAISALGACRSRQSAWRSAMSDGV